MRGMTCPDEDTLNTDLCHCPEINNTLSKQTTAIENPETSTALPTNSQANSLTIEPLQTTIHAIKETTDDHKVSTEVQTKKGKTTQ